jgi:hypothetical protein
MDLLQLKAIFKPVTDLSDQRDSIDVNGHKVHFRVLTPQEDLEVIRDALAVAGDNETRQLEYISAVRDITIARSLTGIGKQSLEGQEFIETGEKLESGVSVRIPRDEAVLEVIRQWSNPVLAGLYRFYQTLVQKQKEAVNNACEFPSVDYDAEIARLEAEISDLKARKLKENPSLAQTSEKESESEKEQESEDAHQEPERPLRVASRASPPKVVREPDFEPEPTEVVDERNDFDSNSSFVDTSDQESLAEAMRIENQKAAARRRNLFKPPHADVTGG